MNAKDMPPRSGLASDPRIVARHLLVLRLLRDGQEAPHERPPRIGNSAAHHVAPCAARSGRFGTGSLSLRRFPGPHGATDLAGLAAWTDRLREFAVSVLLCLRRQSIAHQLRDAGG